MITGAEALGEAGLRYAGRGFDEMTRLAASSFDVWESILATNADYIAEALQALIATVPASIGTGRDAAAGAVRAREPLARVPRRTSEGPRGDAALAAWCRSHRGARG